MSPRATTLECLFLILASRAGAQESCFTDVQAGSPDVEVNGETRGEWVVRAPVETGSYSLLLDSSFFARNPGSTTVEVGRCDPTAFARPIFVRAPERALGRLAMSLVQNDAAAVEHAISLVRDGKTASAASAGYESVERLLQAFAPILRMDSEETYLPCAVSDLLAASDYKNRLLEALSWEGDKEAFLGARPDVEAFLDLRNAGPAPEDYLALYRSLDATPTVYATAATDPSRPGSVCLQYWFPYLYNDWENTHEGDWEHITVILDASGAPVGVVFGRHALEYPVPSARTVWEGTHPVVFVARGSHASYPASGSTFAYVGTDLHRGDGAALRADAGYRLEMLPRFGDEEVAPWMSFGGGWGNPSEATEPTRSQSARIPLREMDLEALLSGGAPQALPFLRGPHHRSEWIRPAAPLTILAAALGGSPDGRLAIGVEGARAIAPEEAPTDAREFERGRTFAPGLNVLLEWVTIRDWPEGDYEVRVGVQGGASTVLLGTIDWRGLIVLYQGSDPGDRAFAFTALDPEDPGPRPAPGAAVTPNPFTSGTTLVVEPAGPGPFRIDVLDLAGRRVMGTSGEHDEGALVWSWDGRTDAGGDAGSGVYFLRCAPSGVPPVIARVVRLR